MDVLDALADKFAEEFDADLFHSEQYQQASAEFHEYCKRNLSPQQTEELDALVGKLSSALFHVSVRSGMKLGAKMTTALLTEGGTYHV